MKGAVKTNVPPPTGYADRVWAASPNSVETIRVPVGRKFVSVRHDVVCFSETEKRLTALMPTTVLFESLRGLMLFQVVRGGIQWRLGLQPELWTNFSRDPHPRPYRSKVTDDERSGITVLPANRWKRLCRPI